MGLEMFDSLGSPINFPKPNDSCRDPPLTVAAQTSPPLASKKAVIALWRTRSGETLTPAISA
jgi:hypothetical protein